MSDTWGKFTFRALLDVEAASPVDAERLLRAVLDDAMGEWNYELDDEPWHGSEQGR